MSSKVTLLHRQEYGEDADRLERFLADTIDIYLNAIQQLPENGNLLSESPAIGNSSLRRFSTTD